MSPARRQFLLAGVPLLGLLGGCQSPSGSDTTVEPEPWMLSSSASVVSRATDEHPLTVEAGLTNESERPVRLLPGSRGGRALEYVPPLTGSTVDLVLFPPAVSTVSVADDLAESRVGGCWRFVTTDGERARRGVVSTSAEVRLDPGDRYGVRYRVYHDGASESCFPAATYRATASLRFGVPPGESPRFDLPYTLKATGERGISIALDGPVRS